MILTTITILAISAVFFAIGKVRSDLVALCALLALILSGILTPAEALSGFSNQVVIMMVGLFVVGGAIFQTGLAKMISSKIMSVAGSNETALFVTVILVTGAIGAFVSNTGTVALMMPIVVSLAARSGMKASRLLMPLAFASSMGGMLTLIGTPPNLVIQDVLTDTGYQPLSFFSFLPVGAICLAVGILMLWPFSRWLLNGKKGKKSGRRKRGKTLEELVTEYHLTDNLAVFRVMKRSALTGKTIAQIDIQNRYGLSVLEVRRSTANKKALIKNVEQKLADPNTELAEGDMLYITGGKEQAELFAKDYSLGHSEPHSGESKREKAGLAFYDLGMAELVLLPNSRMVNRLLKESGFRDKYGVNILGIRRGGEYLTDDLPGVRFHSGDVLLVQGRWSSIARLNDDDENWVVLGQPMAEAEKVTLDYKAPMAAGIMLLMIAMMVFDFIPVAPVTAVMIAGVLMVLTGCFRNVEAAYKTINWESVVLIAAMMPMSVALEKTGASAMISRSLVDVLGGFGPYALLAGIYFTTSLLTMFISNTATAVLMAPIAMASATAMNVSPYPMLFAVTLGASMCFASPFSTPPNALVMQAGQYSFMDYVKVGLPLQVMIGIVMVVALPLLYPF